MARKKTTKKKVSKKPLTEGKTRTNVKKTTTKKRPVKKPPAPVPKDFIEVEGGLLIPQMDDGPDPLTASIEELETPDQLEERGNAPDVKTTVREIAERVEKEEEADEVKPEDLYPVKQTLREKHPKWQPAPEKQIDFFGDLMALNLAETEQVRARMDEIEILCDLYPLLASNEDLDEFRKLMIRNVELEGERQFIGQHVLVRKAEVDAKNAAMEQLNNPQPEKKGFFKRLFS